MRRRIAIAWIAKIYCISRHDATQELLTATEELRDEPSNFRLGLGAQLQAEPIESWDGIERNWNSWTVRLFVVRRLARGDGWEGDEGRYVIARKFGVPHLYEEEALRILSRLPAIPLEARWSVLKAAVEQSRKAASEAKLHEAQPDLSEPANPLNASADKPQPPKTFEKIADPDIRRYITENAAAAEDGKTSANQLRESARKWYADHHFVFGGQENWNQLLKAYPQLRRTAGHSKRS